VLPEAAAAACTDCRAKVESYATVGKRAVMLQYEPLWHEEPESLVAFEM